VQSPNLPPEASFVWNGGETCERLEEAPSNFIQIQIKLTQMMKLNNK